MKIPFTNCQGKTIRLDGSLTIADLTRMGIKVWMESKRKAYPKDPCIYVHRPKKEK